MSANDFEYAYTAFMFFMLGMVAGLWTAHFLWQRQVKKATAVLVQATCDMQADHDAAKRKFS